MTPAWQTQAANDLSRVLSPERLLYCDVVGPDRDRLRIVVPPSDRWSQVVIDANGKFCGFARFDADAEMDKTFTPVVQPSPNETEPAGEK